MIALLRNLVLKDLGLKLFSLAMAILMYCTISLRRHQERGPFPCPPWRMAIDVHTFYNLPVLIVSSAADVRRFKVVPETVAVTVQGDPKILAGLESNEIRALVDLTGIESATGMRKRIEVLHPGRSHSCPRLPGDVAGHLSRKGPM